MAEQALAPMVVDARLPPGPRLPRTVMGLWFAARPIQFMERCARRYGDTFTIQMPVFQPEIFFSHPDAIKEIFTGDPAKLLAGKANGLLGPILGPSSLLLLDHPRHLRERRLMLPPFHGERMHAYGETMRAITNASIDNWPRETTIHQQTVDITFEVILRTVFGVAGENVTQLRKSLGRLLALSHNPLLLLPWLQFNAGPWRRLMKLKAEVDGLLRAEIAARRANPTGGPDILSMLLEARYEDGTAMTDEDLRDEMITLLAAGHETTASALAWAIYHVLSHPEVAANLGDGEYLDAVIKETLRLTPVIPTVGRWLAEPMRIAGYDLPANVVAVPCTYLTHRRPDIWPEPAEFRPERFIGAKPSPYEFLPFGGGVRRCIGAAFAQFEMKIVLAEVFSRVQMKLRPGYQARVRLRHVTFTPSKGVPVIVERKA